MKKTLLNKSGWLIIVCLSLVPAALWIFQAPLKIRFSNFSSILQSLGGVAGLVGMAMFSLVLILSSRLKFFEKFFRGINESYTAHHFFGGLTFCLLLFHPLLLAGSYALFSLKAAALFLLPGQSLAQNFGIVALSIMIITLVITFYIKLKYQIWKFTHKFLGVAFIFAFLHTFLIGGDIAVNPALKIYLFALGATAIAAYFYRTLFADYLIKTFDYVVKNIKEHEDKIWEITFRPQNREMQFAPGQFAFIKIVNKNLTNEIHPFSFSSASGNPMKIAVKELGDYTNKIGGLKTGDAAVFEGPFGAFSFMSYQNKEQVWIAGGVGVAPFLSMARYLADRISEYKIILYYSVKNENCFAFKQELEDIAKNNKNFNVVFWNFAKQGFLTADLIEEKTGNLQEKELLICGPVPMMAALKTQFLRKGVNKDLIHIEEFQLY